MSLVIDGGILAGGLATRMGGIDKGLQTYHGKPMVEHVHKALHPHVRQVVINCNRNQNDYLSISPFVCSDSIDGYLGPLAGVLSIMESSDADLFLISPCDTPCLGEQFGLSMLEALSEKLLQTPESPVLIAAEDQKHKHPLHLCISKCYKTSIRSALESGNSKVMKWMFDNNATWLNFEAKSNFVNFNTLEELKDAQ